MDYDKVLEFAEMNGYKLYDFQKQLLKAICENKMIIYPRQHGRNGLHQLMVEYYKEINNKE